ADRPQLPPEGQLRPLRRATQRLAVHGAARAEPALLALPHLAEREALRALRAARQAVDPRRTRSRGEQLGDRPAALESDPDPEGGAHVRYRPPHDDNRR